MWLLPHHWYEITVYAERPSRKAPPGTWYGPARGWFYEDTYYQRCYGVQVVTLIGSDDYARPVMLADIETLQEVLTSVKDD